MLNMLRPTRINISQLITFYFVGKEGNFSTAAERLCVTQPAVTKQIRALQNQFAVKLVQVKKRKVHLTEAGRKLLGYAEEIYYSAIKAESFLQADRNDNFRVGISSSLTACLTPILDKFKKLNPSTLLSVKEGGSVQIVEELLDFQHDLCIVVSLFKVSGDVQVFRIPEIEEMVVVTSPDGPLSTKKHLTWSDLRAFPLILHRQGSIVRQLILDRFRERNIEVCQAANIDSIDYMKRLVQEGQGVALMLPSSVKEEVAAKRLKILPIAEGDFKLGIDVVIQKGMRLSPACKAFLGVLEAHFDCEIVPSLEGSQWGQPRT
jgi:DNA-binding transcriptional LysR family regulator